MSFLIPLVKNMTIMSLKIRLGSDCLQFPYSSVIFFILPFVIRCHVMHKGSKAVTDQTLMSMKTFRIRFEFLSYNYFFQYCWWRGFFCYIVIIIEELWGNQLVFFVHNTLLAIVSPHHYHGPLNKLINSKGKRCVALTLTGFLSPQNPLTKQNVRANLFYGQSKAHPCNNHAVYSFSYMTHLCHNHVV